MTVNEKLLQYAEYKGISQRKFTASIDLAEGVLRRGKNLGSGSLKKIREKYHDLNMNWLLYDEGDMLLEDINKVNDNDIEYHKQCKNCEFLENELKHAKKLIEAKEETISILKEIAAVKKNKAS